jgi:putative transcriptional regulator
MTPTEVERAALEDANAKPLSHSDPMRLRRSPQAKVIRRALGFTQEEFSQRYKILVGTLRDWEQGRTEPDAAARAYLNAIARGAPGVAVAEAETAGPSNARRTMTEPRTKSRQRPAAGRARGKG